MLLRDFRFAVRMLAENRGFTAISVLCLALSIAANSTIFSLVDGFWTRPLPNGRGSFAPKSLPSMRVSRCSRSPP